MASLLAPDGEAPKVHVVVGTTALGVDRVRSALELAGIDRQMTLVVLTDDATHDQLAAAGGLHVIVDLTHADVDTQLRIMGLVASRQSGHTIVILPLETAPLASFESAASCVYLRRWSVQGLQSWNESPFFSPALRQELRSITGGWPALVEEAIAQGMRGKSAEAALDSVSARLRDPEQADVFLTTTGVPVAVIKTWWDWFGTQAPDGSVGLTPATFDDLATAFGETAPLIIAGLQRIDAVEEHPEGWSLDRAVLDAVLHLDG